MKVMSNRVLAKIPNKANYRKWLEISSTGFISMNPDVRPCSKRWTVDHCDGCLWRRYLDMVGQEGYPCSHYSYAKSSNRRKTITAKVLFDNFKNFLRENYESTEPRTTKKKRKRSK